MTKTIRYVLCLVVGIGFFVSNAEAQFVNFEETWKEFLADNKTIDFSELKKPSKDLQIDYLKYTLMYATKHFCAGEIRDAEKLIREIESFTERLYSIIPGYKDKFDDLAGKVKAYHEVDNLWRKFLKTGSVSLAELEIENAAMVCDKGTLAKYFFMTSSAHYCDANIAEAKNDFENRVIKLVDFTSLKVEDVPGLEANVNIKRQLFTNLPKLGKAWKQYLDTGVSNDLSFELPVVECYSIPSMKEYVLRAAADVCGQGAVMLDKINKLKASNSHPIEPGLAEKIEWLEGEVGQQKADEALLNEAWRDFMPDNELSRDINFPFEYCNKAAQVKAYVIDGTVNFCEKGQQRLDDIDALRKAENPTLDNATIGKINDLSNRLKNSEKDLSKLDFLWKDFVQNQDTIYGSFQLADFYCDKIAQVKSWTIKGHFDPCDQGQGYLDKIEDLQRSHNLDFDEELSCRVQRLSRKVWWCRYIELVLQARRETHEERERFGPKSALIMKDDLNNDKLPCETTVEYEPLGNIGIRYVITTYLCQDIDLAKMGDPEYYKKIATWVDTEVLQKYCEESMRCKEDFFIYLEGHTDGHAFRGARYKESLEIPEGTPYTHYFEGEALEKNTEREITNSLKNNMELGIARAWSVKQQLDFMGVPITIGAYEHPKEEKGGEYRSVQIELNITNLLLDFYEKRLNELVEESGIGKQPDDC
ncbi:MAG: hypothetical protein DWQ02_24735 [Bacteroidetes bacterium]|nr:MAG: hypothetical protein DWQ02_24735 [Bacteroidota bacterium]